MIKQMKNAGTCLDKKEKATLVKMTIQLEEINQNYWRMKFKKISRLGKTIQTKQDIPKRRKNSTRKLGGEMTPKIPTTGKQNQDQENVTKTPRMD